MSAPVDVLVVMENATDMISSEWSDDEVKPMREARAAVAELIEVCDSLDSLRSDPRAEDWQRLYSALSRVRGAA